MQSHLILFCMNSLVLDVFLCVEPWADLGDYENMENTLNREYIELIWYRGGDSNPQGVTTSGF